MDPTLNAFCVDLAASLAYDLLQAGALRLRDLLLGGQARRALENSYQAAFAVMLQRVASNLDQADIQLVADIFRDFVADPATSTALLDLALIGSPEPDLTLLGERFDALDYDRTTLTVDFDQALAAFHAGLTEALVALASEADSPLYNQVSLARVLSIQTLLRDQQGSIEQLSQRVEALPQEMQQAIEAAVRAELQGLTLSQPQLPDDIAGLVAEVRTLLISMREWQRVAAEQTSLQTTAPTPLPLSDIRRRLLEDQLRKDQDEYTQVTSGVAALRKDIIRETDDAHRFNLQKDLDAGEERRRQLIEVIFVAQTQLGLPVGPLPLDTLSAIGVHLQNVCVAGNLNIGDITINHGADQSLQAVDSQPPNLMTREWIGRRLQEAKAQAGQRYTPKLTIDVPAMGALDTFADPDYWRNETKKLVDAIYESLEGWRFLSQKTGQSTREDNNADKAMSTPKATIVDILESLENLDMQSGNGLPNIVERIQNVIETLLQIERALLDDLKRQYDDFSDTPGFRQWYAEYMAILPAEGLDAVREVLNGLKGLSSWLVSPESSLSVSQFMLLRGVAGIGKTHAIVDHALHRYEAGQACFVIFGEDFSASEPWQAIAVKLGLGATIGRDDLWNLIGAAATANGMAAVVYIDALNEPQVRAEWKESWLGGLRQQLSHHPNIKLCVSCRDTFLDEIIDDRAAWPEFVHNGFAGKEYAAIREFFDFYGLQPPATPLLQTEFTNPLFLHLICQGLVGAGLDSLPSGINGFTDVVQLLLVEKNRRVAATCGYDPNDQLVTEALYVLANQMVETKSRLLEYVPARNSVNALHPVDDHRRSLFNNLEKEGLIAVIERRTRPLGPIERNCRFTFERVGDFMITHQHLSEIDAENLSLEFESGTLAFLVESAESAGMYRGILEAMAVIIPERTNGLLELADLVPDLDRYQFTLPVVFSGFQWRDPKSFTRKTVELVKEGLSHAPSTREAIDALLGVALIPAHCCNASLLDHLLGQVQLASRDAFWSDVLYHDFENRNNGWRLIDWALKADLSAYHDEVLRLWSIALSWFCAAADRRVRDLSTKALTRVFTSSPELILSTLPQVFNYIDDDYVLERVSLAAYAALLTNADESLLHDASPYALDAFTSYPTPRNALIRDTLRSILELALDRNLLPDSVDLDSFRPPYDSQWPLQIPSETEINELLEQDAFDVRMKLREGGLGSDFQTYILESRILDKFDLESVPLSNEQIFRWFMKQVADMGYPGPTGQCYQYDRFIVSKYGSGRDKPVWAERLGKKYYWIIARRLLGILSDHVDRRHNSWEKPPTTSLPLFQGIALRDIDPTDLRNLRVPSEDPPKWWSPAPYDFTLTKSVDHTSWVALDDLPNLPRSLKYTDDRGSEWIHLRLNRSHKMVVSTDARAKYPYRLATTIASSVFVPSHDLAEIGTQILDNDNKPQVDTYTPVDWRLFLAEYPNTLASNQQYEVGGLYSTHDFPGGEAQISHCELRRGSEWEYDCSDADPTSLFAPSPELIRFGDLRWDGGNQWLGKDGQLRAISIDSDRGSGLLIDISYLSTFLRTKALAVVHTCYQEKLIVTSGFGTEIYPRKERRSVIVFDGNTSMHLANW